MQWSRSEKLLLAAAMIVLMLLAVGALVFLGSGNLDIDAPYD